jgi:signal transduction histidine kinase
MGKGVIALTYLPYILTGTAIAALTITILCCRKYAVDTLNAVEKILDHILAKDDSLSIGIAEDDRVSKLAHKARRIMDIYISEISQARKEKETIQGLISDMSHQMKTPLSNISMYSDLLIEGSLSSEEQQEFLTRVKSETEKLQWMTDGLIKMSRLEIGAIQLAPVKTGIRQTIYESISSVVAIAAKKNIDIVVSPFDDIELYHDRKWTREALNNILENAIKYSPVNGSIEISVEPLSLYTKITITDHGIGIDKSEFNLIFKRFYRGQNTKNYEGTGLGLYLAAIIMEKQGGYILVDSKPFEYTSFSLFLQNCKK